MISFINRLRSKKGFTMVELIVVIAIIGILTAMILPSLFHSNKPVTGKAMAKAYFYEVQDIVASIKITDADTFQNNICDPVSHSAIIAVTIDNSGQLVAPGAVGIIQESTGEIKTIAVLKTAAADLATNKVLGKIENALTKYTTTTNEMAGTLYAYVDQNCTVRAAYWSDANVLSDKADFSQAAVISNENDNVLVDGFYCCAFPERLSMAGKHLYDF